MTTIDISRVQTELLRCIEQRSVDEVIQLCRDGRLVGVLRFTSTQDQELATPRPIGLAAGTFSVPPEFFEPLPDDLLAAFNGEGK